MVLLEQALELGQQVTGKRWQQALDEVVAAHRLTRQQQALAVGLNPAVRHGAGSPVVVIGDLGRGLRE